MLLFLCKCCKLLQQMMDILNTLLLCIHNYGMHLYLVFHAQLHVADTEVK